MPKKKKKGKKRSPYVVGVDLGATKVLAAVVDKEGNILAKAKRRMPRKKKTQKTVKRITKAIRKAIKKSDVSQKKIQAIGMGAPAPTDPKTGYLYQATNIPALSHFPLGDTLSQRFGIPAYIDNDVNVGTVGEHALGAGRGTRDMVGIFVGTGVGGGIVLDGKLRHGFRNNAGEVGHMIVQYAGQVCGCGTPGCLEAYASRVAIERDIRTALEAGRESVVPKLMQAKGKTRITSGVLAKALKRKDPVVVEVMETVTTYLAVLVATIVNFLDPEMIVIGGGVAEALGERLVEPIRQQATQWFIQQKEAEAVRIVPAELGDYSIVLGGATIAWERLAKEK